MGIWVYGNSFYKFMYFDCLKFSITKTFFKNITFCFIDELNEVKKKIKVPRIVLCYSGWRSNTTSKGAGHFLTSYPQVPCLPSLETAPLVFLPRQFVTSRVSSLA